MRRSHTRKLDDIIREILKDSPAGQKMKELEVVRLWEELVGKTIARKTTSLQVRKGKLYVELSSSVVRNELMMIRSALTETLNKRLGEEMISEIILK